uniref:Uncharacterized protein n=1 Tax=Oryza sativa subsp. japonica TaxID=39947 RepID=Q6ZGL8_ORYSJ|nr:hypothetical protein [Oryza sativa Japonica Group]
MCGYSFLCPITHSSLKVACYHSNGEVDSNSDMVVDMQRWTMRKALALELVHHVYLVFL